MAEETIPGVIEGRHEPIVTEADALRLHAMVRPDHTALHFRGEATSYLELHNRSNRVANGLLKLGIKRAGNVAILAKNSTAYFEIFFGVLKAGMTALPLNWRLAASELAHMLRDAEAEVLFLDAPFMGMQTALAESVPQLAHIVSLGGESSRTNFTAWRDGQDEMDPRMPAMSEDAMVQFYTSGTTGLPKGVRISHRSSRSMRWMEVEGDESWMQWGPEDVAIVALPNFHLSGTSWALQWLARGATCVVQEQVDAAAFLLAIERHRVTHLFAVPLVIGMMLEIENFSSFDLTSLKVIFYGGSPISPPLLRKALIAFRCSFVQIYGMTENNGTVCYLGPADHNAGDERILKSCGRPLPSISMRILDGAGAPVAAGSVGEVCISSPSLMSGYWNREDLKGESFHREYYRTGDAGYRDKAGYLFLVDRVTDMIVSGGENIYPAEIERILAEHPLIAESAVIGAPDPRWGEAVTAVVVRRDSVLSGPEVIAWVKDRIAGYKAPKKVIFVDALPRNANGKVLKRALRKDHGSGS